METSAITAWTLVQEIQVPADVADLLIDGEEAVAAYKTFRDSAISTSTCTTGRHWPRSRWWPRTLETRDSAESRTFGFADEGASALAAPIDGEHSGWCT
jgi:hypothetical protein